MQKLNQSDRTQDGWYRSPTNVKPLTLFVAILIVVADTVADTVIVESSYCANGVPHDDVLNFSDIGTTF
jgi:hypothetical protein